MPFFEVQMGDESSRVGRRFIDAVPHPIRVNRMNPDPAKFIIVSKPHQHVIPSESSNVVTNRCTGTPRGQASSLSELNQAIDQYE